VQNRLLVRLQLGNIAAHLALTGRELGCEQVNTLAYRCHTERKLLQIG
jgi:hypothetical protein